MDIAVAHLITEQMSGRIHFGHHRAIGVPQIVVFEGYPQFGLDFPWRVFERIDRLNGSIRQAIHQIHRRNELRADKIVQERAFSNKKIEFVWDSIVKEIKGENVVTSVLVENVKTGTLTELKIDGIFPYIGINPNIEGINGQIQQDSKGFIITDETMQTSVEGVFAVGDVRTTPLRQVITAAADGAIAGVYAVKYLESKKELHV